ncbi:MAG: hypothetical protein ABSF32_09765 [Ignavibacteria bacterium]
MSPHHDALDACDDAAPYDYHLYADTPEYDQSLSWASLRFCPEPLP